MKDEFMIVSGMPERIGDRHVSEIASMALDLLAGLKFSTKMETSVRLPTFDFIVGSVVFQIPHRPNAKLTIRFRALFILDIFGGWIVDTSTCVETSLPRMGFHSGPAMGVVAGNNIPNYCIMSDTGNLARFEVAILFLGR